MHEKTMKKRVIRTVRRKKIRDLLAVLSFFLLLPYTCGRLAGGGCIPEQGRLAAAAADAAKEEKFVLWEQKNGIQRIPVEEFVVGALAASMPAAYREETLKAQAVILRSICLRKMEEQEMLSREDGELVCLGQDARQSLWGTDFEENEARYQKAVADTRGIVLTWEGEVVSPPFFRMSAGSTRSGAEIFGEARIPWCHSVACTHNLEADDFLQEKRLTRGKFTELLKEEGMVLPMGGVRVILTRDSAGYVLLVRCGEDQLEGEHFRRLFELPSACFYLKEEEGEVILQTKGIGHGLGFDQYGADLLAAEGKDYQELLNYFFAGLTFQKIAD